MHQTGAGNFNKVKKLSDAALVSAPALSIIRYKPVNYLADTMQAALAAADLVVMRPGGTVFGIAAFGIFTRDPHSDRGIGERPPANECV